VTGEDGTPVSGPKVVDNPEANRFEIVVDGEVAGYAGYRRNGSILSLDHTVVDPRYEGQGLGSTLARAVLDTARDEGLAVRPYCPFIRAYIERHPAYLDLVPADQHARFHLGPAPAD
jgi:uncharacterized protein